MGAGFLYLLFLEKVAFLKFALESSNDALREKKGYENSTPGALFLQMGIPVMVYKVFQRN